MATVTKGGLNELYVEMATVTQGGLNELYVENGNGHLRGSK